MADRGGRCGCRGYMFGGEGDVTVRGQVRGGALLILLDYTFPLAQNHTEINCFVVGAQCCGY